MFVGAGISPFANYDYREPRVEGRYFRSFEYWYAYAGFNSNYSKMFSVDVNLNTSNWPASNIHHFIPDPGYNFNIKPRFRASDKLSFLCGIDYGYDPFNIGFANFDANGDIIFGGRILNTYITSLTGKYIFKNDLSLTLNARHYWSSGEYVKYYTLLDNGLLADNPGYSTNNNFSYNAFNIDAVFSWQFAPGSLLSIVYKNAIEKDEIIIPKSYGDNFSKTFESPQTNSISIKVLYYLDYQNLKRKKS